MNTSAANVSFQAPFASVLGVQGYTAIVSVLLVALVPTQIFLSVITITGLLAGKTFRKVKGQRNVMIAIAGMGFAASVILLCYGIAEYLLLSGHRQSGVVFCRGASLFYHLTASMRNYLMACISVVVLITIRCRSSRKIRLLYLNIALVAMLAVVLALGLQYFFNSAVSFPFELDGVLCLPTPTTAGYAGIGLAITLVDIPSRVVSIGVTIASCCIVKKYATLENKKLNVALVKFITLLVVLNIAVFLVNYIPLIQFLPSLRSNFGSSSFRADQADFVSAVIIRQLIDFILPSVPAILTPVMMIAVFKPLRRAIKRTFLSSGHRRQSTVSGTTREPTEEANEPL